MKDYLIVERMEEGLVVFELEDRSHLQLPREVLPEEAKEGDVFFLEQGRLQFDPEETQRRRQQNLDRFRRLMGKDR